MTAHGCGAKLRASVRSDHELEPFGPVPIEVVVAVKLDDGRCGDAFCGAACSDVYWAGVRRGRR
jgi:hypothetical protein